MKEKKITETLIEINKIIINKMENLQKEWLKEHVKETELKTTEKDDEQYIFIRSLIKKSKEEITKLNEKYQIQIEEEKINV